jgi:ubiquinone/menaquinone biosynthesis C-methylase UbiE
MSQSQIKTVESYVDLVNTNATSQLFRAAAELGIFDALSSGQKDLAAIVEACEIKEEPAQLLLTALCSIGIVEKYGDDYALASVMRVIPPELRDLGDRYWQHLARFARTGEPIPAMSDVPLDEQDFQVQATANQWMLTPAALDVVKLLEIGDSRKNLHILDISAGHGVWSLAMAHHDPQSRVTAVDNEETIALTEKTASDVGLSDRLTTIVGNFREATLPDSEFDLAIAANVTHLLGQEQLLEFFRKIAASLKPAGELAVIDVFPGQEKGNLHHALHCLSTALRTNQGRVHKPDVLQELLVQSGFEKPQYSHLPSPPHTAGLILARKAT